MLIILLFLGGILSFNMCRANYSKRTDLSEPLQSWQMLSVAVQHWTWWILSNEAILHEYCRLLLFPLNLLFVFNTYVSQVLRRCFSSQNQLCSISFLSTIAAQSSWWNGLSRRRDGDRICPKKGQVCGPSSNVLASWGGGALTFPVEVVSTQRLLKPFRVTGSRATAPPWYLFEMF